MIYVHIGIHKTGTGSIQRTLTKNRERLLEAGYLLISDQLIGRGAFHGLAHALREYKTLEAVQASSSAKHLKSQLEILNGKSAIISAEYFDAQSANGIKNLMSLLAPNDVRIVVYIRRQEEIITSRYLQQLKTGGNHDSFDDWFHKRCGAYQDVPEKFYNYSALLDRWSAIVGMERMVVRLLDKERMVGGNLIDDFFDAIGINEATRKSFERIDGANVSPSYKTSQLLQLLAAENKDKPRAYLKAKFRMVSKIVASLGWQERRSLSLLSETQAQHCANVYEKSNQDIARRYFGWETKQLFSNKPLVFAADSDRLTPADVAAVMSKILETTARGKGDRKLLRDVSDESEDDADDDLDAALSGDEDAEPVRSSAAISPRPGRVERKAARRTKAKAKRAQKIAASNPGTDQNRDPVGRTDRDVQGVGSTLVAAPLAEVTGMADVAQTVAGTAKKTANAAKKAASTAKKTVNAAKKIASTAKKTATTAKKSVKQATSKRGAGKKATKPKK